MLILSVPYYREHGDDLLDSRHRVLYSSLILLVFVLGSVSTILTGYESVRVSKRKLHWHGRLFLIILYLGAFASNIALAVMFSALIAKDLEKYVMILILTVFSIILFIVLVLEIHFLQYPPKKPLPVLLARPAKFLSRYYVSIGINLCWVHLVVSNPIHQTNIFASIAIHTMLMIIFAFSFERLFWYEVISDSDSKKSYIRTFLAILAVLISGILPIYLG